MSFDRDLIAVFEKNRSHLTECRVTRLNRSTAVINQKILDALLQLRAGSDEVMHLIPTDQPRHLHDFHLVRFGIGLQRTDRDRVCCLCERHQTQQADQHQFNPA